MHLSTATLDKKNFQHEARKKITTNAGLASSITHFQFTEFRGAISCLCTVHLQLLLHNTVVFKQFAVVVVGRSHIECTIGRSQTMASTTRMNPFLSPKILGRIKLVLHRQLVQLVRHSTCPYFAIHAHACTQYYHH
jgi:hypothetical protein